MLQHTVKFTLFTFLSVTVLLAANPSDSRAAEEEKAELDKLPALVQKTAKKLLGNAKVEEIEPAFEDGKHAYEVEFVRGGKSMAVVISQEGKLLRTEDRMSVGDAPEKIQKAVLKQFPKGKISHIKSVEIEGIVHFEVSIQAEEKSHALTLDKDGKILKSAQ